MVSAMLAAAPAESLTAIVSFWKSSSVALTIARSPLMASAPAMCFAAAVASVSDNPEKALRRSIMTSFRDFMLPSESVSDNPSFSISSAHCFGGADILFNVDLSAVPALSPLIPAFAIRPIATAASSMFMPKVPMMGAAYWKVEPISSTFVFAFAEAAAITSASFPASCAL